MITRQLIRPLSFFLCLVLSLAFAGHAATAQQDRPNILWLSYEDSSPHLGCYGDKNATTPNIDKFATQGIRYTHCFTNAGVCAPSRSGIISGFFAITLGSNHLRGRATLPNDITTFTSYLRVAGYYGTNNSKQDYNFATPKDAWDESSGKAHYKNRKEGQPLFAVFD